MTTESATIAIATAAFDSGSPIYAAVRCLWYLALTAMIGAAAFHFAILRRIPDHPEIHPHAGVLAARVGARAAAFCLLAAGLRFGAQSFAVFGSLSRDSTLLLSTTWGRGWILHAASALVARASFSRAARGRSGWALAGIATLAAAAAPAFSGHAAAADIQPWAIVADSVHVLAAGAWIGGLFILITAGFPAVGAAHETRRDALLADVVNAFSPVALVSATLIAATGTWTAWLHLRSLSALAASTYGRVLILKLVAVMLTVAVGAWNWRRVRPGLGTPWASVRLHRSGRRELFFATLVLLVTAFLVATTPP